MISFEAKAAPAIPSFPVAEPTIKTGFPGPLAVAEITFLVSIIQYKNSYKNIYITDKDIIILNSIMLTNEYEFEKEENRWKIFNGFLRENLYESVIKDA